MRASKEILRALEKATISADCAEIPAQLLTPGVSGVRDLPDVYRTQKGQPLPGIIIN